MSDRGLAWLARLLAVDAVVPVQEGARLHVDELVRELEARARQEPSERRPARDRCRAANPSVARRVG
jgi:hypothetical protein